MAFDIESIELTELQSIIYTCIVTNTYTMVNYDRHMGLIHLPRLSLGRQIGHTTVIKKIISDYKHLNFGILGVYNKEYEENYKGFYNCYHITDNPGKRPNIRLDYIIVDNALTNIKINNMFKNALEFTMFYNTKYKCKLIALGN